MAKKKENPQILERIGDWDHTTLKILDPGGAEQGGKEKPTPPPPEKKLRK